MAERQRCIDRVKAVEREYQVVAAATSAYRISVAADPTRLPPKTTSRDMASADRNLEPTYLIRMWAEFETALRSFRRRRHGDVDDQIRAKDLIDWFSGAKQGRSVSITVRNRIHSVREYRNQLVHQRDSQGPSTPISLGEARKRFNAMLQHLPEFW